MTSTKDLFSVFRKAVTKSDTAPYARATVGRVNASGGYTIESEANPNFWYVTIENMVVDQVDPRGAPRIQGLPVFIEIDPLTLDRYISRPDPVRARQFVGDGVPLPPIGPHTHEPGYGNIDYVSPLRFRPGLVTLNGDMTVHIQEQFVSYNAARYFIAAGDFDLTPYIPVTSGFWAWVLVGVSTSTYTYTGATGTEYTVLSPLAGPELAAVDFGNDIPLMGIKVRNGQTALTDWRLIMDCRNWTSGGVGASVSNVTMSALGLPISTALGIFLMRA